MILFEQLRNITNSERSTKSPPLNELIQIIRRFLPSLPTSLSSPRRWEPDSPKSKAVVGTAGYIAPEAYLGDGCPKSDAFSAGVRPFRVCVKV